MLRCSDKLICLISSLFLLLVYPALATPLNWDQPPVACVEEIVPHTPDRPCLDLVTVANPLKDFPVGLSQSDLTYWTTHREPLRHCRSKEVLRREALNPGTFSMGNVEVAWMHSIAVQGAPQKTSAIYRASRNYDIPAQALAGALYQESIYANLGIAEDGGNYSCGVGQVNLSEWCRWVTHLPDTEKDKLDWPRSGVACNQLEPSLVKPFYDIAITRLQGLPDYKLTKQHFAGIQLKDIKFPPATPAVQIQRFQLISAFIDHCSDSENGILAKAYELAQLYAFHVPQSLKLQDRYTNGQKYSRTCGENGSNSHYPLAIPWLMTIAMYNAGPRALDAFAFYHNWNQSDINDTNRWQGLSPLDLIEAFYWSGEYNSTTDRIQFSRLNGMATDWIWFKPCILQRHIARVIQHASLPNIPPLASSLEGSYGCARSKFDENGELIQSAVPPHRQASRGRK